MLRKHRRRIEALALLAAVIVVAVVVRSFIAEAYYIPSASMEPSLAVNDRVVVSRVAYYLHPPRRGDIVVFSAPAGILPPDASGGNVVARGLSAAGRAVGLVDDRSVLIKRVIALPGETVLGRAGRVYVNGLLLREPYLAPGTLTSTFGPNHLAPGMLWVMGDNRGDSEDSRVFGAIARSAVVGRALWRVWPLPRLSFLTVSPPNARP